MKTGRHALADCGIGEHVARDLLDGEPVEGHVLVQGPDHPIAPRPDRSLPVLFITVGVRIPGQIHPAARPSFAVVRRRKQTVDQLYRKMGVDIVWAKCGMARNAKGLEEAISDIRALREEFWSDINITDQSQTMNQSLEKAMRVADFIDLAELMCKDALHREESCGGHFREEYQTADGEALRNDDQFAYVGAWEWTGESGQQRLNKEELAFENVKLAQRSYK